MANLFGGTKYDLVSMNDERPTNGESKSDSAIEEEIHSLFSGSCYWTGRHRNVLCCRCLIWHVDPPLSLAGVIYASASSPYHWLSSQCFMKEKSWYFGDPALRFPVHLCFSSSPSGIVIIFGEILVLQMKVNSEEHMNFVLTLSLFHLVSCRQHSSSLQLCSVPVHVPLLFPMSTLKVRGILNVRIRLAIISIF